MKNDELVRAWSSKHVIDYYLRHRSSVDDLYESERHFLGDALKDRKSILDIGCAAGGFYKVVKAYDRDIEYTGIDISPAMIDEAKNKYPDSEFGVCDGKRLDFADASFDICISFGVLHMTLKWERLLREAWRVCRNVLIFDLRLVKKGGISNSNESYQKLEFDGVWDGISKTPYVILSLDEAVRSISRLRPKARSIKTYGYWHSVSKATVSKYRSVCMACFCLGKAGESCDIDWRLPLEISDELKNDLVR